MDTVARLGDISTFLSGGTPSKGNNRYWNDGHIPWLTPKDMGRWDGDTEEHVTPLAIGNGTRLAPKNAVFLAVRGMSLHSEIRMLCADRVMSFNQDIKAIVPKCGISQVYLFYALQAQKSLLLGSVEASGHGTGTLPTCHIEDLFIPRFGEEIERELGDLFAALDDKIENNRRMNETLEASARALFRDWFVDFGPTRAKAEGRPAYLAPALWSLFPDRLDDEGVPEGWAWESLLDQAHWVNGAAYKNMHFVNQSDGLPVVKIAELKAGITSQTKFTNTDLGARYRIDDGELLFSWSGNPDTSIDAFLWTGGPAWLNQHIFAVRENGKRTKAELFVLLKWLMPEFAEIARNKQTTGLGHVTRDDMKRLQIVSPSPRSQAAFASCIAPIVDQILSNITESRTLAETRDMLLPKLMSGAVRVREASAMAEANL